MCEATDFDPQAFGQLIRRAGAGDGLAINELVERYRPELRRFIRAYLIHSPLGRVDDTDDILQSLCRSFIARPGKLEGPFTDPRHFFGFLKLLVYHKVVDHHRKYGTLEVPASPATLDAAEDHRSARPDALDGKELLEEVRRRHPRVAELLELHFGQGYSWGHIAAQKGVSVETLRKQANRALRKIRDARPWP